MEIFKRTGVHPDMASSSDSLPPLPERDQNRPHVFMDVQLGKESLGVQYNGLHGELMHVCNIHRRCLIVSVLCPGRMVLEVFEDEAPLAARHLLNRFREGTRETVQNTHVHRLVEDMGIFFGTSQG